MRLSFVYIYGKSCNFSLSKHVILYRVRTTKFLFSGVYFISNLLCKLIFIRILSHISMFGKRLYPTRLVWHLLLFIHNRTCWAVNSRLVNVQVFPVKCKIDTCELIIQLSKYFFAAKRLQTTNVLNGVQPPQHSQAVSQPGGQQPAQQPQAPQQVSHQLPPLAPTVSSSTAALQARQQSLRLQRLQVEHERLRLRQQEIIKTVRSADNKVLLVGRLETFQ